MADHTHRQALAFLCEASAIDTLIVDQPLTDDQRAALRLGEVRVLVAGEQGEFD